MALHYSYYIITLTATVLCKSYVSVFMFCLSVCYNTFTSGLVSESGMTGKSINKYSIYNLRFCLQVQSNCDISKHE